MPSFNKTQTELLEQASRQRNGYLFIDYALATSRRSNDSFGLKKRDQARKLVAAGVLVPVPELSEYGHGSGCAVYRLPVCSIEDRPVTTSGLTIERVTRGTYTGVDNLATVARVGNLCVSID